MIIPQLRVRQLVREHAPKTNRLSKLRLDLNENIAGWPAELLRTLLSTITPDDLSAYPETYELHSSIASHHNLKLDQVIVTAGSEMAIRYVFEAFLGPGTELLILDPSFAMFEVYGRLFEAEVIKVPFDTSLKVSMSDVLQQLTSKTRVVAVANPNNPTGTIFCTDELLLLLRRAAAVNCLVLIDEAYFYFYGCTMAPIITQFDNLIVTRTFSKAFGLAGVRLGYALAAPAVIAAVAKLQPIDHTNVFAAKLGQYAIEHEELAWEYARDAAAGKTYLVGELRTLGFTVIDSHGNFILVDAGPHRAAIIGSLQQLVLLGTNVRLPFSNQYLKVTVGPVQQMGQLLALLRKLSAGR